MYYFYRKSNRGHGIVRCTEIVRLSESPLQLEVSLYTQSQRRRYTQVANNNMMLSHTDASAL